MTCWLCCVRRCVRNRAGKQRSRGCRRGPRARAQIFVAGPGRQSRGTIPDLPRRKWTIPDLSSKSRMVRFRKSGMVRFRRNKSGMVLVLQVWNGPLPQVWNGLDPQVWNGPVWNGPLPPLQVWNGTRAPWTRAPLHSKYVRMAPDKPFTARRLRKILVHQWDS